MIIIIHAGFFFLKEPVHYADILVGKDYGQLGIRTYFIKKKQKNKRGVL